MDQPRRNEMLRRGFFILNFCFLYIDRIAHVELSRDFQKKGNSMKDITQVKNEFMARDDSKLFEKNAAEAVRLHDWLFDNGLPVLNRAIAAVTEQWRAENAPDVPFSKDMVQKNAYSIGDFITNRSLFRSDVTSMYCMILDYFYADDPTYHQEDVGEYISSSAEEIINAYHELFDD